MTASLGYWMGLSDALRRTREAKKLRLADIGNFSPSHLSRVERNQAFPTEQIIRAYEDATGARGLTAMYHHLAARVQPDTEIGENEAEVFYETNFLLDELDSTVVVGDTVRVTEQRTIRPLVPSLSHVQIRQGMYEVDGQTPKLLGLAAVKARLDKVDWISKNFFGISLTLPVPLSAGMSHRFTLEYEFDFLFPRYTFQPLVQAQAFRLTLQLPSPNFQLFEFRGQSQVAASDFADAVIARKRHGLEPLNLDRLNEIERSYTGISPGLCYGIIWRQE